MSKQDDQIEKKLKELEASIEAPQSVTPSSDYSANLSTSKDQNDVALKSDLYLVVGSGLILLGIFLVMNHVQVGTGFLSFFGFQNQGFGLTIIPLLIGIGMIFFNAKNRLGWILTAASCALIFFAVLSHLVMIFPTTSLLGLIIMFLPLAVGGALISKGLSKRQGFGN